MLIWVACTAVWGGGDIQTWLLLWTMSASMILSRLRSVLKSRFSIATKGHSEPWGKSHNLRLWWCLETMPPPELSQPEWQCCPPEPKCHPGPDCCWEGRVWVHGLAAAAAGIYVDVCGVAYVTSRSHRNHAWWNQRSILSWPQPSLAQEKLALPFAEHCSKIADSDPQDSHGRAGPCIQERWSHLLPQVRENWSVGMGIEELTLSPHLRWVTPVAWNDQLSYYPCPQLGLGLAHFTSTPSRICGSSWRNWLNVTTLARSLWLGWQQ